MHTYTHSQTPVRTSIPGWLAYKPPTCNPPSESQATISTSAGTLHQRTSHAPTRAAWEGGSTEVGGEGLICPFDYRGFPKADAATLYGLTLPVTIQAQADDGQDHLTCVSNDSGDSPGPQTAIKPSSDLLALNIVSYI